MHEDVCIVIFATMQTSVQTKTNMQGMRDDEAAMAVVCQQARARSLYIIISLRKKKSGEDEGDRRRERESMCVCVKDKRERL